MVTPCRHVVHSRVQDNRRQTADSLGTNMLAFVLVDQFLDLELLFQRRKSVLTTEYLRGKACGRIWICMSSIKTHTPLRRMGAMFLHVDGLVVVGHLGGIQSPSPSLLHAVLDSPGCKPGQKARM
ncbi:hypothetical protein NXS19_004959 [Fusarium pseudograminearum]|nr:hypothetical protein NXS19_004959 [Fusarium pseudograminearum]